METSDLQVEEEQVVCFTLVDITSLLLFKHIQLMSVVVELAVLEMVWVLMEVEVSSVLYLQQVVEVELSKTKTEDLVGQVEETELMETVGMNLQEQEFLVKDILAVKVVHLKTQPLVEVVVQTKQEKTDITDQIVDLHREETEDP